MEKYIIAKDCFKSGAHFINDRLRGLIERGNNYEYLFQMKSFTLKLQQTISYICQS